MDVSPAKRIKIITLKEHTSKTYRQIASVVGVSLSSVSRIIRLHCKTGSISPKRAGRCGRKRKTTSRDDAYLLRESVKDPRKSSDDLNRDLQSKGIKISSSTVRRRLLAAGRKARRPVRKQLLTRRMKQKRLNWARKYRHWTKENWRNVLFSDESHMFVQGQRSQHVRRSDGEVIRDSHINQTVKHPQKTMFWGCFSYFGVGVLHPVEGMMRSSQYVDVLRRLAIPELSRRFRSGTGIFQHDMAPCHTSAKVKGFLQQNQVTVLDWPGNSPDLNPIENLWSICKSRLRKMDCSTKSKLHQAVIQVWYNDSKIVSDCEKLVDSMPERVSMVLRNRGDILSIRYDLFLNIAIQ